MVGRIASHFGNGTQKENNNIFDWAVYEWMKQYYLKQ